VVVFVGVLRCGFQGSEKSSIPHNKEATPSSPPLWPRKKIEGGEAFLKWDHPRLGQGGRGVS